ncbi:HTH-type transcriptional regulator CysB [Nitrosococcus oceani]|uniref:HTH-type transcriptional regulator CysB n=1 Tax=Nitrosococcus oceani TaxID=1229 RepID=UPI0004E8CA18|nr:HTH-type transcriptional regulator CysB [Nitrosococcus oceani]KFI22052.1 CysB family transcriptional regulator [Nitrosococcus oceani]
MKLQQLHFVYEVSRQGYNVSAAAEALHATQPGVSNRIHQLERELGVPIFERHGKRLTGMTPAGKAILKMVERILREVENIKQVSAEATDEHQGILSIATTHTQARYALPLVIKAFRDRYPQVRLRMFQGTPRQIAEMAAAGTVDLAIATEAIELFEDLIMLPCYEWNRSVVVPPAHPLLACRPLTLEAVAKYPIITYVFGFTGRSKLDNAFASKNLVPNVILTATDADVIKTYLHLGLGIGIIASMAFDPDQDAPLKAIDASHLFEPSTTHLGIRRGAYLRGYIYAFIELFSPQLTRQIVDAAVHA